MPAATEVLDVARAEIGTREARDGSTPYHRAYGLAASQPWCAVFLWWVFHQAGASGLIHPRTAYTPTLAQWFRDRHQLDHAPRLGDIVFYDWPDRTRRIQHVGIVEAVEPGVIVAIEGNTSTADQSNGGQVMRRRRTRNSSIAGYGHPAYGSAPAVLLRRGDRGEGVAELQRALNARGQHLAVDGVFGALTQAALRHHQRAAGITADGVVGPQTRAALGL